jgi:hypothetical protein
LVPEPIYSVRNPNVPLALSAMIKTHTVIKTEVVQADGGKYAVRFTYDDGTEETAIVGKQLTAEFYAKNQLGEIFPVGVNPLLLNAKEADELRQRRA